MFVLFENTFTKIEIMTTNRNEKKNYENDEILTSTQKYMARKIEPVQRGHQNCLKCEKSAIVLFQ